MTQSNLKQDLSQASSSKAAASQNRLQEQVKTALTEKSALYIRGGGSKAFYGNSIDQKQSIDLTTHTGIVEYQPSELCLTVRAGTRLTDLEAELAKHQQMLPFEPPLYTDSATIGGTVATGLSGPRCAYSGAVRDAVLGMKIINGKGEVLSFGGQVMKNVAGYDVTRLMTGSLGTLGVILEVSIKVIPKPAVEQTLTLPCAQKDVIQHFSSLRTSTLPITATCYVDDTIYVRISGSQKHIDDLIKEHSLLTHDNGQDFWHSINTQTHPFFENNDKPLWRLSIAPATPINKQLTSPELIEWGGAIRWVPSNIPPNIIRDLAKKKGGHALCYGNGTDTGISIFPEPEPALFALYKSLKQQLDPQGIFNPGRMYKNL